MVEKLSDSNGNSYESNRELLSLATNYFDYRFLSNGIENANIILEGGFRVLLNR